MGLRIPLERLRIFFEIVFLGLFFLVLGGPFARISDAEIGKSLELVESEPLTITAESLTYLADERLFVAEGHVEILYRQARLVADYVEFNEDTGDALAVGNVLYEEGIETISAERAEFNFDSELGVVTKGDLSLEDDQYITGKEIYKTGKETYTIKSGSFTACDSAIPAWKFNSTTSKVHQGEYLQAWNTVGFVKGIPIFYFPYFVFPIKTDRQSGLLIPDLGRSTLNGYKIGNAFFWAISDSQDATFSHTYYEKRGHKIDLEYRYKYSDQTDGTFFGQYVPNDKIDNETRRRFQWNHLQGLPYKIKGRAVLDLTSDELFDYDFDTTLDQRSNTSLKSTISLTRNYPQHTFKLLFDRLDSLVAESNERQDQRFPEFSISSQRQQVFNTPLYFRQRSEVARLIREGKDEEQLGFDRMDIFPTLSLPINLLGSALTLNPELDLRFTYYTRDARTAADHDLEAESIHREYYAASIGVDGPKFNGIFELGADRKTQKLKHLIEPTLSFNYAPAVDKSDLPKFDSIDQVGSNVKTRNMTYGLSQRLLAKQVEERDWEKFLFDEEGEIYVDELSTVTNELLLFNVAQSYNLEKEKENFSDIDATLKITPFTDYDLTFRTAYDMYVNKFVATSVDMNGSIWDAFTYQLRWRRNLSIDREENLVTDTSEFIDGNLAITFFSRLQISYRGRFNLKENESLEDTVSLTYNGQCWNILGNFSQQLIGEDRERGYQILLELKNIGKLLDIKG